MTANLVSTLRFHGRSAAGPLLARLGISRATLMRAVHAAGELVIVRGRARRTAYAARRPLRGSMQPVPLYRVDRQGDTREVGRLHLAYSDGCALELTEDFGWPLDGDMSDGWFDGLPYPLQDMRPQGFLGRNFARHHAAMLQVGDDPATWSDDDVIHALSLLGTDTLGDFIIGDAACRQWLLHVQQVRVGNSAVPVLTDAALGEAYPRLADEAMAQGVAGSSAGGEFPKFTAVRLPGNSAEPRHVLVKFSGSDDAAGTQRWSDLLVCEHLASRVLLSHLGIAAAESSIHRAGGRTFLEVVRFDRHGLLGRSGLCSWFALNAAVFGTGGRPWTEAARQLTQRGWLSGQDGAHVERVWHFGQLIGNSDMHDGNLSFLPAMSSVSSMAAQQGLSLAPVYDMLPMLYAPGRGVELPQRTYAPRLPLPAQLQPWQEAAGAAVHFWDLASADERISAAFRDTCSRNAALLRKLAPAARTR